VYADGRPPIVLDAEAWPVVASASRDDYPEGGAWALAVRQHECGRAVVYGIGRVVGAQMMDREIVPPGGDIAAAARRIGASIGAPKDVVTECTAPLEN
jgi:hypothetical protein